MPALGLGEAGSESSPQGESDRDHLHVSFIVLSF